MQEMPRASFMGRGMAHPCCLNKPPSLNLPMLANQEALGALSIWVLRKLRYTDTTDHIIGYR